MLSLTCKAAIKAVIYLAAKFETEEKASIKEIAGYINENEHTVGKLLQKLVKEKVINSAKGPNGGFYITPKQKQFPLQIIVEAIDGKGVFIQCGLGLSKCSDIHPCPIHNDYKPIRDMFKKLCQNKRICDLEGSVLSGLTYLIG